jgi:hypothetical protein
MRGRGGYIGFNRVPEASALNSAASGVWTLREAESLKRGGTWPVAFVNPTQLSGLQIWLDASDSSTLYDATTGGSLVAADGTVKRWEDKSGNSRHATEATNGPARKTAIQGGKDVLRFDGSNDLLSVANSTETFKFVHSADSTVFLVFSTASANPEKQQNVIATFNTSSAQVGFRIAVNDASPANDDIFIVIAKGELAQFPLSNTASGGFASGTFAVASFVNRPTNAVAANRSSFRRNSGSAVTNNSSTVAVSTSNSQANLTIGVAPVLNIGFFDGDICEIIIYNSALSDANRTLVENYLLAKWGIT